MIAMFEVFFKEHPGIVLVVVGVLGEGLEVITDLVRCHNKKFKRVAKTIANISWIILVIGLFVEMRETVRTDTQILTLVNRANDLYKKGLPRDLTEEQIERFVLMTKRLPKIPVRIFVAETSGDSIGYGIKIRKMFDKAGFPRPEKTDPIGVEYSPNMHMIFLRNKGMEEQDSVDLVMIMGMTNIHAEGIFKLGPDNDGIFKPTSENNTKATIFNSIEYCFKDIKLKTTLNTQAKTGEFFIAIPPQLN